MTGDIVNQVFPGDAHQVLANVVDVIFTGVLAVTNADILVDGRKAHGHGAGTGKGGLVHQGDFQPFFLAQ